MGSSLADASGAVELRPVLALVPGALLLFSGGMALNAVVDRDEDGRSRPGRPVPSGAVSARGAAVAAGAGLVGAPAAAFGLTGSVAVTLWVAGMAGLILVYHSPCRRSPLVGPLLLGSIRSANLLQPVVRSAGLAPAVLLSPAALAYLAYVAGASMIAHQEDRSGGRGFVRAGQLVIVLAVGAALAPGLAGSHPPLRWLLLAAAAAVAVREILRRCLPHRAPTTRQETEALATHLLSRMPVFLLVVALAAGASAAALVCLATFLLVRSLVRFVPPT